MKPGRISLLAAPLLACLLACADSSLEEPPPLDPELQAKLAAWLDQNGKAPVDYVVDLFSDHEVVFLSEQHRIKHDVLLVQSLLRPLHDAGVRVLATEFGRRADQSLIDSVITASEWHEDLAREIIFSQFVGWGYQEYVDVYRAAWTLNRDLPGDVPPFRILGMNDSPDWSLITKKEDRDDAEIMKQVWRGGGEDRWADVILQAFHSGEKVLVHCGIHHAFTAYRQPIVLEGVFQRFDRSLRCGNHVFAAVGKRAVTVFLHAPWSGRGGYDSRPRHPADGIIDALMLAIGPRPVGFDVAGGPFGELAVGDAVYSHGYDDFRLVNFCDGWIYTMPISEYVGVTTIPDWIDEENLRSAREQSPNPELREASVEELNRGIARSAEISRRWGHLR